MRIIGLTGPSGAGKGSIVPLLAKASIPYLDTDEVYHRLVSYKSPCVCALSDAFGSAVLETDGSLDRKRLAEIVFCGTAEEKTRLSLLNAITHKFVLDECRLWLRSMEADGYKAALIDAPLLYESGFDRECDTVIAIIAPKEQRLQRIIERDAISKERALSRINAQPSDDFYKERADFLIVNDGDKETLLRKTSEVLRSLGLLK